MTRPMATYDDESRRTDWVGPSRGVAGIAIIFVGGLLTGNLFVIGGGLFGLAIWVCVNLYLDSRRRSTPPPLPSGDKLQVGP